MDFLRFGLRKRRQNRATSALLPKTQFLRKSLFSLGKIIIFLVRSLEKSTKIGCSNAIKNNIEKKNSKIEFGKPFGFPKSLKMDSRSNVKRSLFCDAMETARTSSQVNGNHGSYSVQKARHMIRSSPSIHPSIDPLLVALIIEVCPST